MGLVTVRTTITSKVAVTVVIAVSVIEQLMIVPLHVCAFPVPRDQPAKIEPASAVACIVTTVPEGYDAAQGVVNGGPPVVLQPTVPVPVPTLETVSVGGGGGLNVAVMLESPVGVKVQVVVVVLLHTVAFPVPGPHPANPEPVAVNVTESPLIKTFEQVVAQLLMPIGVDETVPLPAPAKFTVTVENELCRCVVAFASETSVIPGSTVVSKFTLAGVKSSTGARVGGIVVGS
jgi:hypothetical protein